MPIIKTKLRTNFSITPNEAPNDMNLSISARGLLWYLLAKPSDWEINMEDIQRSTRVGKNKAYAMINELVDAGYIIRKEVRGTAGFYKTITYYVYDVPRDPDNRDPDNIRDPDNRDLDNRGPDKGDVYKENKLLRKDSTKKDSNKRIPSESYVHFEKFWSEYPNKKAKAPAKKAFDKALKKTDIETIMSGLRAYVQNKNPDHAWLHASTFLNQERWNDEYDASDTRRKSPQESDFFVEVFNRSQEILQGRDIWRSRDDPGEAGGYPAIDYMPDERGSD